MYCMISENTRVLLDASKREFEVKSMLLRYISVLFLALKCHSSQIPRQKSEVGKPVCCLQQNLRRGLSGHRAQS